MHERPLIDWESPRRKFDDARPPYRLWVVALLSVAFLVAAWVLRLPEVVSSIPPSGRATVVPEAPVGRAVYLAPLGDFPVDQLASLSAFYEQRYGITVQVLPVRDIPAGALDQQRDQLIGERVIEGLLQAHAEARSSANVVIGVASQDMYLVSVPQWAWAFGLRQGGRLAVLSTARMASDGVFAEVIETARLRKLTTKYIGTLYFGLQPSNDPRSVLYNNILGPADLDRMGEDF